MFNVKILGEGRVVDHQCDYIIIMQPKGDYVATGRCNFISVGMINDDGPQSSSQLLCGEEEGVVAVILSLIPPSKFAERSVHS